MEVILYCCVYLKKAVNEWTLPFLNTETECYLNSKSLPKEFFELCQEYGRYNETPRCYIFDDTIKLYEFLSKDCVPDMLNEALEAVLFRINYYLKGCFSDVTLNDLALILWII